MPSMHSVETYQENELTRNSSRNIQPQLSQLAEPVWTDPGLKRKKWHRCARADLLKEEEEEEEEKEDEEEEEEEDEEEEDEEEEEEEGICTRSLIRLYRHEIAQQGKMSSSLVTLFDASGGF